MLKLLYDDFSQKYVHVLRHDTSCPKQDKRISGVVKIKLRVNFKIKNLERNIFNRILICLTFKSKK